MGGRMEWGGWVGREEAVWEGEEGEGEGGGEWVGAGTSCGTVFDLHRARLGQRQRWCLRGMSTIAPICKPDGGWHRR